MTQHVKLRTDRDEQIYFSINADKNADVQLVVSTRSLTIFLDFTLTEAKNFRSKLDRSIAEYEGRKRRLDRLFKSSMKKSKRDT